MITVSDDYKTSITTSPRRCKAKITFDILDVTSHTDATATVTSEASISHKEQMFDQIRESTGKYLTLENDYWKLDGSFILPPKASEVGSQVGYWSNLLSGSDGTFSTPQVITVDFTLDHSSIGLTIAFDKLTNEYASDFTIVVKDSGGTTIHTEMVMGNTLSKYILEQNLSNYRQIIITITKWVTGYRRVRVSEIDFGIVEEYAGEELIRFNLLEELDTINKTVSANELKFTVDNQDKRFDILSPTGIYNYLQRRQKIYPYIGVEKPNTSVEYVPMGIYYLNEWKSDEGTLTATFTARDTMDVLAQDNFSETSYTSKTLKYIAEDILTTAGITDYSVSSALTDTTVTASITKMSFKEALQLVAIAARAVVYIDRSGVLQMKRLSDVALDETIDLDNCYNAPLIELEKLINTIYVVKADGNTYTYVDPEKPVDEATLSISITNSLITNDAIAGNVAQWVLAEYKKRFLYTINWRQNPAFEGGDILSVENEFGAARDVRITKNEFTFAGTLSGKTSGKGA